RPALPPSLASPSTPRPSARALAPANLDLRPPQTSDWTCALCSGNSFSRRLSPFKGIRNPNSIPARARAAASFFLKFQLNAGHPLESAEVALEGGHEVPPRPCVHFELDLHWMFAQFGSR